ncbi:MAG: hypothetical protein CHACPFDD_00685 [Phycisphaerae bacterium]|nr:hypothetical protein [Phycisphaerae bacterium]
MVIGCHAARREIFPDFEPPLVWPPPPDTPRIRYVGELVGEDSLGVTPDFWSSLGAIVEGPPPRQRLVTPAAVAARWPRVAVADPGAPGGPAVYVLDLSRRTMSPIRIASDRPLMAPVDVAVADAGVAVVDARRAELLLFGWDGQLRRSIGHGELTRPAAVTWDEAGAALWVLDAAAHTCVAFSPEGRVLRRIGRRGDAVGEFNFPAGIALSGAAGPIGGLPPRLLVADAMNFRVQVIAADDSGGNAFGRKGDAAGDFSLPRDVAVDSDGHVYVLDSQFENVQVFDAAGRLLLAFGGPGRRAGEFSLPSGICIDDADRIWIADTYNRRIQVFQYLREPRPAEPRP